MPVLFLLSGFFTLHGRYCADKCEIRHGPLPVPNFTFIGAELWEYSTQNSKFRFFFHKFVLQGRLVCTIFRKFSAFIASISIGSF